MHSTLTKGDWVVMAADMMDPTTFKHGDTVSLCLVCDSKQEIEDLYAKLPAGGEVFMALDKAPFGWFAMFTVHRPLRRGLDAPVRRRLSARAGPDAAGGFTRWTRGRRPPPGAAWG